MEAQSEALDVYKFIEDWWGDALDEQLIARIAHAPALHVQRFAEDYPSIWGLSVERLEPGQVRPVYGDVYDYDRLTVNIAPQLLLYVDTIVENALKLNPFWPGLTNSR